MPKKTKPIKDPVAPSVDQIERQTFYPVWTEPMQDPVDPSKHLARRRERHKELLADHLFLPKQEKLDKMRAKPKKYVTGLAKIAKDINQFDKAHPAPSKKPKKTKKPKHLKKMDAEQTEHFENHREIRKAISRALQHPTIPDPETAAKHRLAPSERQSPYEYGTLEWCRNELALAQDRIRLLEDERDWLMIEGKPKQEIIERVLDENVMRREDGRNAKECTVPANWREIWDTVRKKHPDWQIKQINAEVVAEINRTTAVNCTPGALRMARQRSNHKKYAHKA